VKGTIVDEWEAIRAPPPPDLKEVAIEANETALMILDIQNQNCNYERRPRCVSSIPKIESLLGNVRAHGMLVIYSLTRNAALSDIREEVAPLGDEPTVKSGSDKFFNTSLESILANNGIKTLILVGTSAHGAVLNTAMDAALRNFHVIVPVDGISATEPYAEQYTIWHLSNAPGCKGRVTLTRVDLIQFQESPC